MSTFMAETRADQANRLREAVREVVERSSFRQAEAAIGISVGSIRSLLAGGTPQGETMAKLNAWASRIGIESPTETAPPRLATWKDTEEIGRIIRGIRKKADMSQDDLAQHLGMGAGQAEISRYENGLKRPDYEKLVQIAALVSEDVSIFQEGAPVVRERGEAYGKEESPEDAVAANWPSVASLGPEARAFYYQTRGEWEDAGWTLETRVRGARDMTAFLRAEAVIGSGGPGKPALSDQEQLIALKAARMVVESRYGPGGPDSKR